MTSLAEAAEILQAARKVYDETWQGFLDAWNAGEPYDDQLNAYDEAGNAFKKASDAYVEIALKTEKK